MTKRSLVFLLCAAPVLMDRARFTLVKGQYCNFESGPETEMQTCKKNEKRGVFMKGDPGILARFIFWVLGLS